MAKIIKIGVLYLSRLEIDNRIDISMTSDKEDAKTFYDDNFLDIAMNIIHNTINVDLGIIEEKEGEND